MLGLPQQHGNNKKAQKSIILTPLFLGRRKKQMPQKENYKLEGSDPEIKLVKEVKNSNAEYAKVELSQVGTL